MHLKFLPPLLESLFECRRSCVERAGTAEDYRDFASGGLHVGRGRDRSLLPRVIGAAKEADPENPQGVRYCFSATSSSRCCHCLPNAGMNRMDHAAFNTADAEGMRKYLAAKGWKTPPR